MSTANSLPHAASAPREASLEAGDLAAILERAHARALASRLDFSGELTPQEAWTLFKQGEAILVDVRTAEERQFIGYVAGTPHVAWATGPEMIPNPNFLAELEALAAKDALILFLCRSAKRSASAAEVAARAGFHHVFNVLEGFEGDLDETGQRGRFNGWRFRGLPWVRD